jgi:hypothetical protein
VNESPEWVNSNGPDGGERRRGREGKRRQRRRGGLKSIVSGLNEAGRTESARNARKHAHNERVEGAYSAPASLGTL